MLVEGPSIKYVMLWGWGGVRVNVTERYMGWVGCLKHYLGVGGVSGALHGGGWVGCVECYMGVGGVS